MSPRSTFTNWGSSSSRNRRSQSPTRVIRSALSRAHSECAASVTNIVRNLSSRKRRPARPTRSWTKRTGPGESRRIAIAIAPMTGASTTRPTSATARLSARPSHNARRGVRKSWEKMRLDGVSASMAIFPVSRS